MVGCAQDFLKDIKHEEGREVRSWTSHEKKFYEVSFNRIFEEGICHLDGMNLQGISLFEVKNRDLLTYMSEVVYLMGKMSFAESIENCSALERCVFLRTVLERIRPVELKLKPYVEKAMSFSTSTSNSKQMRMFSMLVRILEDEDVAKERVMERARRRALQSSLISELRAQYSEAPEEVQ
uniref:Uncharacterized protein n=1 Tax=Parascaris equorum TaxID=6256 RepID=A0A914RQA0_PAREQ